MYSWEITNIMKTYDYCLPSHIYLDITENSPQINHVTFNGYDSHFEMWDIEGVYWNFEVYYQAA